MYNFSNELTQNDVKILFSYDPNNGYLVRIKNSGKGLIGDIINTIDKRGDILASIHGKKYQSHRIIWLYMTGEHPKYIITHINGDSSDNRFENLREKVNNFGKKLSCEILKSQLNYDSITGIFTRIDNSGKAKIGDSVGYHSKDGYLSIGVNGKKYLAHRLVWMYIYGEFPKEQIDHINRNKSDNRICNLREATHAQNQQNRNVLNSNKSGVSGVSFSIDTNKWVASVGSYSNRIHLGSFDNFEDACIIREKYAKIHYKQFYNSMKDDT